MTTPVASGLFLCEGSTDQPLAELVEQMFARRGVALRLTAPDFSRLPVDPKTLEDKVREGISIVDGPIDIVVVHRDADTAGSAARLDEIRNALAANDIGAHLVPIIPVRALEAWLLLDEKAIRRIAGNPNGSVPLDLPKPHEAERNADPKAVLAAALTTAADESARRRRRKVEERFSARRKRLVLELDEDGRVQQLQSWLSLVVAIDDVVGHLIS